MCKLPLSRKAKDIAGHRFGKLVAIEPAAVSKNGTVKWKCRCDCGGEAVLFSTVLRNGKATSCGCDTSRKISAARTSHGKTNSPTWLSWKSMKARCGNPNSPDYKDYGGRGIEVCDRWMESFENFCADMGERPEGMTLDRIDSNGNYEPGNCQWATPKAQASNRSSTVTVDYMGERLTMSELARRIGVTRQRLRYYLIKRAISVDEAIATVTKEEGFSSVTGVLS